MSAVATAGLSIDIIHGSMVSVGTVSKFLSAVYSVCSVYSFQPFSVHSVCSVSVECHGKGKGIINFTLDSHAHLCEVGFHAGPAFTFPS